MRSLRPRHLLIGAVAGTALLTTACGSGPGNSTSAGDSSAGAANAGIRALLPKRIQSAGVITVGTPQNNAPVISKDAATGKLEGIVPEVAQKMGDLMGVRFEFKDVQFPGVIPGVQARKFDVSMGFLADTKERQQVLTFVDLLVNKSGFLVKKGNPTKFTDLPQACGHKLGGLQGSQQVARMRAADAACRKAGRPGALVKQYASPADAQAQVQSGVIDAFMMPKLSAMSTAKAAGGGNVFEVLQPDYPDSPYGIAMAKSNAGLDKAILAAMKELKANGEYDRILKEHDATAFALRPDQVVINGAGTPAFS